MNSMYYFSSITSVIQKVKSILGINTGITVSNLTSHMANYSLDNNVVKYINGDMTDFIDEDGAITYLYKSLWYDRSQIKYLELPECSYIYTNASFSQYTRISLTEVSLPKCSFIKANMPYLSSINAPLLESVAYIWTYGSISSIDLQNVKNIGPYTFTSCSTIQQVIGNQVETIDTFAFAGASQLTEVSFPKCKEIIGTGAFQDTSQLMTINLPECQTIDRQTFANASKLQSVLLPTCTHIGEQAFNQCFNLSSILIADNAVIEEAAFYCCSLLTEFPCEKYTYSGNYIFLGAGLYSANFIGTEIPSSTFCQCKNLSMVSIPNATSIGQGAFIECPLQSISLPLCSYLENYAFLSCSNLSLAYLPSCTYLGGQVFSNCTSLESVYLLNSSYALRVGNAFDYTPIVDSSYIGHYGSIYVPTSLYNDYISYNTSISGRFVSMEV